MANVFRQFLLDAENGDVNAVNRNIEHGIELDARDDVRYEFEISRSHRCFSRFDLGSTDCTYSRYTM